MHSSTRHFLWNEEGSRARFYALNALLDSLDVEERDIPTYEHPDITGLCRQAMREAKKPCPTDTLMNKFREALQVPDKHNIFLDQAGHPYEHTRTQT